MDDDDGFDDFLDEEEEASTLQTQEMAALARRMKTVGVREAIDHAKESALQEGFDDGFVAAAHSVFQFSALRGALCVALVSGLANAMDAATREELDTCIEQLRTRSLRVPVVTLTDPAALVSLDGSEQTQRVPDSSDGTAEDDALITRAREWLRQLGFNGDQLLQTSRSAADSEERTAQ